MDGWDSNPFQVLTSIVAPAILTNASSVMALGTSNRFARTVDRARVLYAETTRESDPARLDHRLRQLQIAESRVLLLVRALTAFYSSVGSFAAAALISLLGAVFTMGHQNLLQQVSLYVALAAGMVGVGGLVTGTSLLVWETRRALKALTDEAAHLYDRLPSEARAMDGH
ncbi:MAG: DUF2721 domain-containing protein [Pirellulales bacterium]|nr:DUF2721 domain-containing protein [Pirellulales bacterium]